MASVVLDADSGFLYANGILVGGGGSTVSGNETIRGSLTVIQPQGGGTRAAYFTDGQPAASENSVAIFCDQTSTLINCVDNGTAASLTYEGAVGIFGEFSFTAPLRVAEVRTSRLTPVGSATINVGDSLTTPAEVIINASPLGGGARALSVTDNGVGPLLNSVDVYLNQAAGTLFNMTDKGSAAQLSYDGVLGQAKFDKPLNLNQQCGITGLIATGTAIPAAGVTATSVILVTQLNVVGHDVALAFTVTPQAGQFVISFVPDASVTKSFSWFVAKFV